MEEAKKKTIFSPNKIVAIIFYILSMFVLGSIITIIIGILLAMFHDDNVGLVIESFTTLDLSEYSDSIRKINAMAQGWGNFIVYLLCFVVVVFYMRDEVIKDFKDLVGRKEKHMVWIPLFTLLFMIVTYAVEILIGYFVRSSANQETIETIIQDGGMIPMIIATVLFAPVVEELIYRKAIFSYFKKYSIGACYLISTVFFMLPHMISSDFGDIRIWVLQAIPYLVSGLLLCVVYHKSQENVFASIIVHFVNNFIASLLIITEMNMGV